MAKWGICYQGGKSKLAERIVDLLPSATNLYDLFAGGCALTHCALQSGKWQTVHANDITDSAIFFKDVALGKYKGRNEWISRDDFFRLKDSDPWVRLLFSFSNDQRTYLYGKDIEQYKESVHWMLTAKTVNERRLLFKRVIREAEKLILQGRKRVAYDMEFMERVQGLEQIEGLERIERLEVSQSDYRDVEILPDSATYCDIPYRNTCEYRNDTFDHDAFYEWALRQTAPLFISEYDMPSDFVCVAEFERVSTFSATNNSLRKTERIFRPRHQL